MNWQDRQNPRAGVPRSICMRSSGDLRRGVMKSPCCARVGRGLPSETVLDGIRIVRAGTRYTFALHARSVFQDRFDGGRNFDVVVEDVNKCPLFCTHWSTIPVVALVPHLFGVTAFRQESPPVAAVVWAAEKLMPAAYRNSPILAISESTADDLVDRGFRREQIEVSYPGIDHEFYNVDSSVRRFEAPTLVYAGRLQRYKSLDVVLRSLALLRDRGIGIRFHIAGHGGRRGQTGGAYRYTRSARPRDLPGVHIRTGKA